MRNRRIVIDRNIFISAIIGQYSYPYKIFSDLVATGEFQIFVSDKLIKEYREVSQREKFEKYPEFIKKANDLISTIENLGVMVKPSRKIELIKDLPDNHLLEIAVEANEYCIITGNTNDFDFDEFEGIKIFTPKEFYNLVVS